jgi:2-methylisocitrate lyase-like PEP mutase family enzyme
MLWMVERIAQALTVPVSADLEAEYGDSAGTAAAAIEAGAVGLNLALQPYPDLNSPLAS